MSASPRSPSDAYQKLKAHVFPDITDGIFQDLDIDAILRTFLSDSSATYSVPIEWRTGEEANWPVPVDFPRIDPLMGYIYNGEFLNPLDGSFC